MAAYLSHQLILQRERGPVTVFTLIPIDSSMMKVVFSCISFWLIRLSREKDFLAHRIRIHVSEILPWDRKSYLTHAILPQDVK